MNCALNFPNLHCNLLLRTPGQTHSSFLSPSHDVFLRQMLQFFSNSIVGFTRLPCPFCLITGGIPIHYLKTSSNVTSCLHLALTTHSDIINFSPLYCHSSVYTPLLQHMTHHIAILPHVSVSPEEDGVRTISSSSLYPP